MFVAFSAARASAATIDFTNAAWNPRGNDVFTVGNVTVEAVSPSGQLYWYNGFEVPNEARYGATPNPTPASVATPRPNTNTAPSSVPSVYRTTVSGAAASSAYVTGGRVRARRVRR